MQTCRFAYSVTVPLLIFLETWAIVHGNDDSDPSKSGRTEKQFWDTGNVRWCQASCGMLPSGAVAGGWDRDHLYVGRAEHEGHVIPGKVQPSHSVCYIPWDGKEHPKTCYQVLCGCSPTWVGTSGGNIPPNAIPGGRNGDGELLFIGRVQHEGTLTIGKVQPSHRVLYIPFNGAEVAFSNYEILVSE